VAVSSDEAFFSAVNYRGFPRQLTAAGFQKPRQLTADDNLVFYMCFSAFWNVWTTIFKQIYEVKFLVELAVSHYFDSSIYYA